MSDVVIRVENLSKKYVIGRRRAASPSDGLRHVLQNAVTAPLRKLRLALRPSSSAFSRPPLAVTAHPDGEEFYALRDVSFEVKRGEVLGIIGRNGAGKSTLLKVLSRITEPSSGRIGLKGRVASLLEVGTGFHPDLTGRENIYLNGAILGMHRAEVRRKFEEITSFSEVEEFLDTPVKHYSTGMYMRLAFSVAAHLEPEIMIVDEVLAVGDADFQKKCLGKMEQVAKGGRTVLFVSHNIAAVTRLCSRALVLDHGRSVFAGAVTPAIDHHLSRPASASSATAKERVDRRGTGLARCIGIASSETGAYGDLELSSGGMLALTFTVESAEKLSNVVPGLNISDELGRRLATLWCGFTSQSITLHAGINHLRLRVARLDLAPGLYGLSATLGRGVDTLDDIENIGWLNVLEPENWHPIRFPQPHWHGYLLPEFEWLVEP